MDLCDRQLQEIRDQVVNCQKCSLYQKRHCPVVGEGNHRAQIMFVGEAPGRQEDASGRPFCGAAGQVLSEVLAAVGLQRKDVYIANILKCWPPGNRNPLAEEINACGPYLDRQIEIIQPQVICPMGNFAAQYLIKKYGLEQLASQNGKLLGISRLRGQVLATNNLLGPSPKIVPLYHPAVATYNPNLKPLLIQDYQVAADLLQN